MNTIWLIIQIALGAVIVLWLIPVIFQAIIYCVLRKGLEPPKIQAQVKAVAAPQGWVLRFINGRERIFVTALVMTREVASACGISAPAGFVEEELKRDSSQDNDDDKEHQQYVESFNRENIRWTGKLLITPSSSMDVYLPTQTNAPLSGFLDVTYIRPIGLSRSVESLRVSLVPAESGAARIKVSRKAYAKSPELKWNAFNDFCAEGELPIMSPLQRTAFLVYSYEREVQNGGHDLYFEVMAYVDHQETIKAFGEVGAVVHAEILRRAWPVYQHKKDQADLASFDQEFYSQKVELMTCLERYLDLHEDEFVEWVE